MRTQLVLGVTAIMLAGGIACGKAASKEPAGELDESRQSRSDDPRAPVELVQLDLEAGGITAVIKAPRGATVQGEHGIAIVRTSDGTFHLELGFEHADIGARRADIEANTVNRLARFVIDEPTALVYESRVAGTSEYHVLVNATAGDVGLSCEDSKGPVYSESMAMAMLEACRSISGKP